MRDNPWTVIDQQEDCQTLQRGPWIIIDDAHEGIRIDFMNIDGVKYYYPPTNLQEAKDWTYEMDLKDEPITASEEKHPMNPTFLGGSIQATEFAKDLNGPLNMTAMGKEIPLLVTTEYTVPKETYQQLFAAGPVSAPPPVVSSDKSDPKASFGTKKPGLSLVPGTALMMLAKVMALGAKKYGAYNWRVTEVRASVYIDALLRHVYQWWDGEDIDPESGAPHLAHAMACLAIILDALAQGTLIDDRPTAGRTNNVIKELTEQ